MKAEMNIEQIEESHITLSLLWWLAEEDCRRMWKGWAFFGQLLEP